MRVARTERHLLVTILGNQAKAVKRSCQTLYSPMGMHILRHPKLVKYSINLDKTHQVVAPLMFDGKNNILIDRTGQNISTGDGRPLCMLQNSHFVSIFYPTVIVQNMEITWTSGHL